MVTYLTRALFVAYLLILLWLVLFKFSYDPFAVIQNSQIRSLNLIPFAATHRMEMIANVLAFVPFGVMLGVVFKRIPFARKVGEIFAFSLAVEVVQYGLAIGVADITDLIMNTLGGLIGISGYAAIRMRTSEQHLDAGILITGTLLLGVVLFLRVFVFIVRY